MSSEPNDHTTALSLDDADSFTPEDDDPTRFRIFAGVVALTLVAVSVVVVLFL